MEHDIIFLKISTSIPQTFIRNPFHFPSKMLSREKKEPTILPHNILIFLLDSRQEARVGFVEIFAAW